ncbi:MAG TPA: class I SAM-dependent methyltransferase [Patescibacteria group bacterium]
MKNYAKINKQWWNEVTPIHAKSSFYNLDGFKAGQTSLFDIELNELKKVKGKTLLHPLCHFGMDTLSWAREGAIVTGVDLSNKAISLAQKLSTEVKVPATFICSDIYALPNVLDQKFDIIFCSYGVLCWISNLKKWATIISHFLNRGGTFYIVELHPFTNILSADFKLDYKYFDRGPYVDDSTGTYTDWEADIHRETYIWNHPIGEVVNSLIDQGLKIEFVHEFPYTMYDQFPGFMKKNKQNQYFLKNKLIQIPLLFSLKATKM